MLWLEKWICEVHIQWINTEEELKVSLSGQHKEHSPTVRMKYLQSFSIHRQWHQDYHCRRLAVVVFSRPVKGYFEIPSTNTRNAIFEKSVSWRRSNFVKILVYLDVLPCPVDLAHNTDAQRSAITMEHDDDSESRIFGRSQIRYTVFSKTLRESTNATFHQWYPWFYWKSFLMNKMLCSFSNFLLSASDLTATFHWSNTIHLLRHTHCQTSDNNRLYSVRSLLPFPELVFCVTKKKTFPPPIHLFAWVAKFQIRWSKWSISIA